MLLSEMIHVTDIHPLNAFLRDHKAHLERLAATGRPEVLTVDGKARVVVQDAQAYEKMVEAIDSIDAMSIVRERLAAFDRGEPGTPIEQVLDEMRAIVRDRRSKRK